MKENSRVGVSAQSRVRSSGWFVPAQKWGSHISTRLKNEDTDPSPTLPHCTRSQGLLPLVLISVTSQT